MNLSHPSISPHARPTHLDNVPFGTYSLSSSSSLAGDFSSSPTPDQIQPIATSTFISKPFLQSVQLPSPTSTYHVNQSPSSPPTATIPRSVKDAPAELRIAIRRQQNNESARRCRIRREREKFVIERKYKAVCNRIVLLEHKIRDLCAVLLSDIDEDMVVDAKVENDEQLEEREGEDNFFVDINEQASIDSANDISSVEHLAFGNLS